VSAIFGLLSFDGHPVSDGLRAMDEALAYRGPDGGRCWQDETTGLGHRAFWTTPEAVHEGQPLVDASGLVVLTMDGRIDNRRDLIAALDIREPVRTVSDATLALTAYLQWGESAPSHLIGDFAFAIRDGRSRTIFCARDPMGVRPFYYAYRADRFFAFASHVEGLVVCGRVSRRINEDKVAAHLLQHFEDRTATFYEDIVRLEAAHALTIGRGRFRLRRYWDPDDSPELRVRRTEEFAEGFRERFIESVRCRTRTCGPVGSMLSGGLDSSSISCTADRVLPTEFRPVRTFSAIFPTLPARELRRADERPYMEAVLAGGTFDHSWVHADQVSPLTDARYIVRQLGGASLALNLYIHWAIYKTAASKGVRVLLDGIDGDTTVSHGFEYLTDLARTLRFVRFYKAAAAVARRNRHPFRDLVRQFALIPLLPSQLVQARRSWRTRNSIQPNLNGLLSERLRAAAQTVRRKRKPEPAWFSSGRTRHVVGLRSALYPYALELADAAAAAFPIEARYPFFDRRLIEFCVSVPPREKLHDGWTRMIMRRAIGDLVPEQVRWRQDKADLSPNFARALYHRDRDTIQHVLTAQPEIGNYVNLARARAMFDDWCGNPLQLSQHAHALFGVATLGLWLDEMKSSANPTKVSREGDYPCRTIGK
jgi:asparagine synthase (glutamine-hydrolysing)